MACVSLLFALLLGDVPPVSEGFALLGTFAVGQNDFSVSVPYLILCYALVPAVLKAAESDFDNTFFSYIPNSAQVSFHGMLAALEQIAFPAGKTVRFGQIAIKDAKFRTFIADAASRREL